MRDSTRDMIELLCMAAVIWAAAVWIIASVTPFPLW